MVTKAWRMLRLAGHDVLFCLLCDTFTFDPQDIAETYCEHCDRLSLSRFLSGMMRL